MPVLESDLKLYGSLYMPRNDTDINGGGIDTANEITGEIGEVFNLSPKASIISIPKSVLQEQLYYFKLRKCQNLDIF